MGLEVAVSVVVCASKSVILAVAAPFVKRTDEVRGTAGPGAG